VSEKNEGDDHIKQVVASGNISDFYLEWAQFKS
jgi:hypothetical protein